MKRSETSFRKVPDNTDCSTNSVTATLLPLLNVYNCHLQPTSIIMTHIKLSRQGVLKADVGGLKSRTAALNISLPSSPPNEL